MIELPISFSSVIPTRARGNGRFFSVRSINLEDLGIHASPLAVFDDFRVRGRPFEPHPHAGFAAATYVFEDSQASLRSHDSIGGDHVVAPGGIVWTHAGSGLIHEELPAQSDYELHGLQFFVNLSAKNKLTEPHVLTLQATEVPEWSNQAGDRARVVVGSHDGVSSPLVPVEPFNLLDVGLRHEFDFDLPDGDNALIYVPSGDIFLKADGLVREAGGGHALALFGCGRVSFEAIRPSQLLVLSGPAIREPVFFDGPFIMNDRTQCEAALKRYHAGDMGRMAPITIE